MLTARRMISISGFRTVWQNKHGVWCVKSILFDWLILICNEFQMQPHTGGTTNGCVRTDIIHEAEKWNHDERLDCLFMHTHTNTQTRTRRFEPVQWIKSQNYSLSNQQSAQAPDPSGEQEQSGVYLFYFFLFALFIPTVSSLFSHDFARTQGRGTRNHVEDGCEVQSDGMMSLFELWWSNQEPGYDS